MTTLIHRCAFCIHFKPEIRSENVCTAFPEGIPRELALEGTPHIEPWPGDGGIQFEALPGYEYLFRDPTVQSVKSQIPWARPKR